MGDEKGKKASGSFLKTLTKKQRVVFGIASSLLIVAIAVVAYMGITGKLKIGADSAVTVKSTIGVKSFSAGLSGITYTGGYKLGMNDLVATQPGLALANGEWSLYALPWNPDGQPASGGVRAYYPPWNPDDSWRFVYEALGSDGTVLARRYSTFNYGLEYKYYMELLNEKNDYFAFPPGTKQVRVRRLRVLDHQMTYTDSDYQSITHVNEQLIPASLANTPPLFDGSASKDDYGNVDQSMCEPGPGQIAVFTSANYEGRCAIMNAGDYENASKTTIDDGGFAGTKFKEYYSVSNFNDQISSIKVNQAKVTLYTNSNYGGSSQLYTSNNANFAGTPLHDSASSAVIRSLVLGLNPNPVEVMVGETKVVTASSALSETGWFGTASGVTNDTANTTANALATRTASTTISIKGIKPTAVDTYATVKVIATNGAYRTLKVKVLPPCQLSVVPTSLNLQVGQTQELNVTSSLGASSPASGWQASVFVNGVDQLDNDYVTLDTTAKPVYKITAKKDTVAVGTTPAVDVKVKVTDGTCNAGVPYNTVTVPVVVGKVPTEVASFHIKSISAGTLYGKDGAVIEGSVGVGAKATIPTGATAVIHFKVNKTDGAQLRTAEITDFTQAMLFNPSTIAGNASKVAEGDVTFNGYNQAKEINIRIHSNSVGFTDFSNVSTGKLPITIQGEETGTLAIGSFTANPTQVTAGGNSTLSWTLTGSTANTTCSIDQGVGSVTGVTSKVVTVLATTIYTLSCTDPNAGSATDTATVTVTVPTCTINVNDAKATPSSVTLGDTSTLTWSTTASGASCSNEVITCTVDGTAATSGKVVTPTVVGNITYGLSCTSEHGATKNATIPLTVTGASQCGSGKVALPVVTGKWWVKTLNTVPPSSKTLTQIMGSANLTYFFDGFGSAYGKGEKATATDYLGLGFWLKKKTDDGKDYLCVDSASAVGKTVTKALPHQALNMIGTPLATAINPHKQLKFKFSSVPDKTYTLDEAFASGYVKAFFIWDGSKYLPYTNLTRYPSFNKYGYQSYTKIADSMATTDGAWISTRSTETVTLIVE